MFDYLMTFSYIIDTHWAQSLIRWVFYIGLVIVFFKSEDSRSKHALFWYPVIILCVLLNPITIYISGFLVEKNTFGYLAYMARQYSMVPIFYTIAYAGVLLIKNSNSRKKMILTGALCICFVLIGNGFIYRNAEYPFSRSENAYKMPTELLMLCDYMDGVDENPVVAMPGELSYMARQYDPSLHLLVGKRDQSKLALELDSESPDVEYILQTVDEQNGEYIIVHNMESVREAFTESGYEPVFETMSYLLYQK